MKKSRFFLAAGGLVLAISAVLATKANKRFTPSFSTVTGSTATNMELKYGSNIFTTSGGGNLVAVYGLLYTESGKAPVGNAIGLGRLNEFTNNTKGANIVQP
jgi:hypothetical protein